MIAEITTKNISILDNSFLTRSEILNELKVNPFAKVVVYIENSIVIGYLYYSDIYERVEINQIEVDSFHKNCGIGSKLMKFLTKTVDKSITLEVREDNIPAIKLYKKFGFKKKATRKNYYQRIDGILMERER